MPVHYPNAAARHWRDGEFLRANKRLPNANQLFCLAAECVLKALLVHALGVATMVDGDLGSKELRVHIDKLWDQFILHAAGRRSLQLAAIFGAENPFRTSQIRDRYFHDSDFAATDVEARYEAARKLIALLEKELPGHVHGT